MPDEPTPARRCHACGGEMLPDIRPVELEYQGVTETALLPGAYCVDCGESVHSFPDMMAPGSTDDALARAKARVAERDRAAQEAQEPPQ